MGSDLAKAVSTPVVEAVRACTSLSSESDCKGPLCECHTKSTAASDEEICTEDKPT